MAAILFYSVAAGTILTALLVVVQPNPVGAALALVAAFFGLAVLFVGLEAHFIAVMQLLLYAGAIMVFFLFVIMLLNLQARQLRWKAITGNRLIRGSMAIYLLALLLLALLESGGGAGTPDAGVVGTVEAVGSLLLSAYLIPFEVTSLLLLVAMIGAVVMGRRGVR